MTAKAGDRRLARFEFPPERVEKPWGWELVYARTDVYCGKVLFVRAGHSLSLQYHRAKDETIYLHAGRAEVTVGDGANVATETVEAGRGFRIKPGMVHRLHALEDSTFLEVSTPHLDDVVRLEDAYGREDHRI